MPEPTIIQSSHWTAAARLDGGHQTFAEAMDALHKTGAQFDPAEMSQQAVVEQQPGVFRLGHPDEKGAVLAWVIPN